MHVNLMHWKSLQLKTAIIPDFSSNFLGKNHKTRNSNLYNYKNWVRSGHFDPKGSGPTYTKGVQ